MISSINIEAEGREKIVELLRSRNVDTADEFVPIVKEILHEVKNKGDDALIAYTSKFDWNGISKNNLKVTDKEIEEAYSYIDDDTKSVIKLAVQRVKSFHEKQKQNSWVETSESGQILGQIVRALDTVGLYIPGGKAVYPSSVIMTAVPAKVAGVKKLILTTPCGKDGKINPAILVAAKEAEVDEIYRVGGAQAVGAMAYGTATIPRVDKIVGPGNIYVALAKKLVYGVVDIDMIAGPSEILIIADESAEPEYVAADMLSQAEHDEMAAAILVTTSQKLASKVQVELEKQIDNLPRKLIAQKSIENYGRIIVCSSLDEAIEVANSIAPEHLELCVKEPFGYIGQIKNAGAIFVGSFSPEPMGDYLAGPSHVLPTSGTARFYSSLSVDHFVKKSSLIWFDKKTMESLGSEVIKFAELEGLQAHANSLKVRMEK